MTTTRFRCSTSLPSATAQAVEIGYRQREPGNIVIDFVKKQ